MRENPRISRLPEARSYTGHGWWSFRRRQIAACADTSKSIAFEVSSTRRRGFPSETVPHAPVLRPIESPTIISCVAKLPATVLTRWRVRRLRRKSKCASARCELCRGSAEESRGESRRAISFCACAMMVTHAGPSTSDRVALAAPHFDVKSA